MNLPRESTDFGSLGIDVTLMSSAIVFGHADADGHIATEQSRLNLEGVGIAVKQLVVGPETWNYRFWEGSFAHQNFESVPLVVTVDIAFRFRDPSESLRKVIGKADENPNTHFVVVDHHTLGPTMRPRPNLTLVEVESVVDCCLGPPLDDLMVVAAICDGQDTNIIDNASSELKRRALGVRRAAADLTGVGGSCLLDLIKNRRWDIFEAIAEEPIELHRSIRGRRKKLGPSSPVLESIKSNFCLTTSKSPQESQM